MKSLTCAEAEERLELYAAGECAEPEQTAIRTHLEQCPRCTEVYRQAQQLLSLLDAHYQAKERLGRLRARLDALEIAFAPKPRIIPFLRRAASLAAMLLVMAGLSLWLGKDHRPGTGGDEVVMIPRSEDFYQWPRTILPEAVPGHAENAQAKLMRDQRPSDAATVRAKPGTQWQAAEPFRVRLTGGEIFVQVPRSPSRRGGPFQVITPFAEASTRGADFLLQVQPNQVVVTVTDGVVELANPQGRVVGSRGESIRAQAKRAPARVPTGQRKSQSQPMKR
jgi:ferric-dicitrate binding protein FerR (iron transport regulator)